MLISSKTSVFSFVFVLGTLFCLGQETTYPTTIVTDRPDATEASSTVGKGILQFETGVQYDALEINRIKQENYTFNTMLIRYGILDNLELRLGWDFVEGITSIDGNQLDDVSSGLSPLLVGMKIDIAKEDGNLPEIALIGHVFPIFSASTDYRPETTSVDFRLSLSHTLSERSSLGYNIGAQWGNDSPEAEAIYTLAYGYSFTDRFGMYAEIYGEFPEDSAARHFWNGGFTYLAHNNLQLDTYFGTGITDDQDIRVGLGFSYRVLKQNN